MQTSSFDYDLPAHQIAQAPAEPRDSSRLMVVHRSTGQIEHRLFRDVGEYLKSGDLLILNQTRVIRARLLGRKVQTGGRVELLLLNRRDDHTWEALVKGKGLRTGIVVELQRPADREPAGRPLPPAPRPLVTVIGETDAGGRLVQFDRPVKPLLDELGVLPLPPYIHKPLADPERYQTVYGQVEGSVAASTAGLHFTPDLLVNLRRSGIEMAFITLHIGLDTFRPVKTAMVEEHQIHTEWYQLTTAVATQINRARLEGRRVVAVGTTCVRALESAARPCAPGRPSSTIAPSTTGSLITTVGTRQDLDGASGQSATHGPQTSSDLGQGQACGWRTVSAYAGPTSLYIYPGYRFQVVDALVTNFHLPRSTLLMLVAAFAETAGGVNLPGVAPSAGRDLIMRAYSEAIRQGYRFFSLGDAMLLV